MMNKKSKSFTGLRDFPSVEVLSGDAAFSSYLTILPRPLVVNTVKSVINDLKERFRNGDKTIGMDNLIDGVKEELRQLSHLKMVPLINGTGIIIHTNLGRAPLPPAMLQHAIEISCGYSNLEYDVKNGRRGGRGVFVENLLASLCEAPAGTVVNNNAAALFVILNTLAMRREVIISRGELVQIGGGFRIPEIMVRSGVKLVEVGTTNKTSIKDYSRAITPRTKMILKVHRSNFTQTGFVEETDLKELHTLCRERELLLVHDLGSGLVAFPNTVKLAYEPCVMNSVRDGADLICFSGDKLLGGPQAGLIVGNKDLISKLKKNPLYRTIRCDKLTFSLMEQVLSAYLNGTQYKDLPIWQMIVTPVTDLKMRGEKIIAACSGKDIVLSACEAYLGGGTTPSQTIPSLALSLRDKTGPNELAKRFRSYCPPIIGRVDCNDFLIDLRTIPPEKDGLLIEAIDRLLGQ